MPRQANVVVENKFVGGLKTEFTGLNFPENACTATDNCIFDNVGRVTRRPGIDQEINPIFTTIDRSGSAVSSFLWKDVSGDGTIALLAMQVGGTLHFYEASNTESSLSGQKLATTITLSTFSPAGAPSPIANECQYASGEGYLFIFHPHLEPFYLAYDAVTKIITASSISIRIRDFVGIDENIPDTQRPTTLTAAHRYNLGNQGWRSGYLLTSTTSNSIATGSKTFATNIAVTATPIVSGDFVKIYSSANHNNFMTGVVTTFTASSMVVNVTAVGGSGTHTDWNIGTFPNDILTWNDALANFPSNADVWWLFKNTSDVFAPATTVNNIPLSNRAATKGHYVVDAFNINRSVISGIPGLTTVSTTSRPATGAFFQGRVFYSGINASDYHSNIYFSQIIEGVNQFGRCYQDADPTDEVNFEIQPTDGGVISIAGAGTLIKLFALKNALLVFASNGIWAITGSQGLGFTAIDYTISKVSSIKQISPNSFIDVYGFPMWWTREGIYSIKVGVERDSPQAETGFIIQSLTDATISSFYDDIPLDSKIYARGAFDPVSFIIQWIFRSTSTADINQNYEFDSILNLNTQTGAFYVWSLEDSTLKVNGINLIESVTGPVSVNNVVDGSGNNVVDASGNQVVTYSVSAGVITPVFKYIISKPSGVSYSFSFADVRDPTFSDWVLHDGGHSYESSFVTGFAVHGQAQRFFQNNYVYIFSDALEETSYAIQGIWDFANEGNTGYWSSKQRSTLPASAFNYDYRKYKIRGKGLALQLRVTSTATKPFSIIGWSRHEMINQLP